MLAKVVRKRGNAMTPEQLKAIETRWKIQQQVFDKLPPRLQRVKEMHSDIADLLAEVRRLRCCGNCKAYKFKVRYEDTLREVKPEMICLGVDGSGKCDKWEAADNG